MSEFAISNQSVNIREVDPDVITNQRERKAVLAMRAVALLGCDGFDDANARLSEAAFELGEPATMTYEDLIFINPLERGAYVLSAEPQVAQHEVLFYSSHKEIEDQLADGIDALLQDEVDATTVLLQGSLRSFGTLYRQLDRAAFAAYRPYFVGINGYPGPSGLFTAAIPIIDLLTHGGENIADDERTRLITDVGRGLYPSHQSDLLEDLLLSDNPQVDISKEAQDRVTTLLNRFRKVHKGSVRKFVPQALESGAEGSGGVVDVADYLSSKIVAIERSEK